MAYFERIFVKSGTNKKFYYISSERKTYKHEMGKFNMYLDFSNYNQDLVKLVCSAIFNDKVARYQDLKDLAWDNGYNENEVMDILQVLMDNKYISNKTPLTPLMTQTPNNDFMVTGKDKTPLVNQGLL